MTKYLQKLGRALMLPLATLPLCAVLMGVGYLLAPAALGVPGATAEGAGFAIGYALVKISGALLDNIAWLIAVGAAAGLSKGRGGAAAISGLAAYLMISQLLSPTFAGTLRGVADLEAWRKTAEGLAFLRTNGNVAFGLLAAVIGAECADRCAGVRVPAALSFLGGKKLAALAAAGLGLVAGAVLQLVWPILFEGIVAVGQGLAGAGSLGAGLFAFLNRLLMPLGLDRALNETLWYDTIGLGDLTRYWAGQTAADAGWGVGMYMAGFFPCMIAGVPAACLALARSRTSDKKAAGFLAASAAASLLTGVTAPLELALACASVPLFLAYAALYGAFSLAAGLVGFRAGFCLSGGAVDFLWSSLQAGAANTWLVVPLAAAAAVAFYFGFKFAISRLHVEFAVFDGEEEEEHARERKVIPFKVPTRAEKEAGEARKGSGAFEIPEKVATGPKLAPVVQLHPRTEGAALLNKPQVKQPRAVAPAQAPTRNAPKAMPAAAASGQHPAAPAEGGAGQSPVAPAAAVPAPQTPRVAPSAPAAPAKPLTREARQASLIILAMGGKSNIKSVSFCATRLRFELADSSLVNAAFCKKAGVVGLQCPTPTTAQVIVGPKVQFVHDELAKLL